MIFRHYEIFRNGLFHSSGYEKTKNNERCAQLAHAEAFLKILGKRELAVVEFDESDQFNNRIARDKDARNTFMYIFFLQQLNFFVSRRYIIAVVNKEMPLEEDRVIFFGRSVSSDISMAEELGLDKNFSLEDYTKPQTIYQLVSWYLNNFSEKSYWIERWNERYLVIRWTQEPVESDHAIRSVKLK